MNDKQAKKKLEELNEKHNTYKDSDREREDSLKKLIETDNR